MVLVQKVTRESKQSRIVTFVKNPTIILFLSMLLSRGIDFLTKSILGRILGPEQFGIIQQYETYLEIFIILSSFGISTAVLKFVSEKGNDADRKIIFSYLIKMSLGISIILCCLLYAFVNLTPVIKDELVVFFLNMTLLLLPFIVLTHSSHGLLVHFLNGVGHIHQVAWVKIAYFLLQFLILIPIIFFVGITGFVYAFLLLITMNCLLFIPLVYKHTFGVSQLLKKTNLDISEKRRMHQFIGFSAMSSISSIIIGYIDLLIVIQFFGNYEVGLYGVANVIVKGLWILPLAIMQVELPKISRGHYENTINIKKYYTKLIKKMMILTWPIVIIVYLLSHYIIYYIFGSQYVEIVPVLKILLLSTLFYSLTLVGGNLFIATNHPNINLLLNLARGCTYALVATLLTPIYDMKGVAYAMVFTFVVYFMVQSTIIHRKFKN